MKHLLLIAALLCAAPLSSCTPAQRQAATTIAKRAVADILLPYVQNLVSRGQIALRQVETKYGLVSLTLPPDADRDRAVAVGLMDCSGDLDYLLQVTKEANFTRATVDTALARFRRNYDNLLAIVATFGIRPQLAGERIMGAAPDGSRLVVTPSEAFTLPPPSAEETGASSAPPGGA